MVKLAETMLCPLTLTDISTVTWSGKRPGIQKVFIHISSWDVRVPPLGWHHSQALTLASRKGWKLGPGQEVAVGNLMVISRARYPGHCPDIVPIVTSHLHTAEAGKAA